MRREGSLRPVPEALRITLALLLGVGSGILSGMFGVGGAVVSTPGVRALGATAFEGVGSTIPATLPAAISGSLRYHREGLIRWRVAAWTASVGTLAVIGGALLSHAVPGDGHLLMIATAVLMLFTAYRTARPATRVPAAIGEDSTEPSPSTTHTEISATDGGAWWLIAAVGVVAGGLSGLLGIGGGVFMVPAFVFLGLGIKEAVGTSLVCVGVFAIPGGVTHTIQGDINWAFAIPLCIGVIPGARIGSAWAIRASDATLRRIVATGLGTIAVVYGVTEVLALF